MVVVGGEATSAGRPINGGAVRPRLPRRGASKSPIALQVVAQTTLASARQWCGSKGAYNRPSYPCYYCTYRGGLLRQGAVDKAKADDQRHAGERQHHHLKVRKAVVGRQRKIVHDMLPKDVPVVSRSPSLGRCYQPMRRGRAPASVPAPQQARPSSPDCTDRSHPHWSAGCSPMKSHDRSTLAGSCHGCDTAYPCRRRKGTSR